MPTPDQPITSAALKTSARLRSRDLVHAPNYLKPRRWAEAIRSHKRGDLDRDAFWDAVFSSRAPSKGLGR
jgi:hypothetical protein